MIWFIPTVFFAAAENAEGTAAGKKTHVRRLTHSVALAMWDFSWLVRCHAGGGFENIDQALDELCERGYNAVRIDVFPHLLALPGRNLPDQITFKGSAHKHVLWGNDVDVTVRPLDALVHFLQACRERHVYVEFSTWYYGNLPEMTVETIPEVQGFEGFVRSWEETIAYLEQRNLMDNILFIDLLNEYPRWHFFRWLNQNADTAMIAVGQENHIQTNQKFAIHPNTKVFYKDFSTRALARLRQRFPQYDFCFGYTVGWDAGRIESYLPLAELDVVDGHIWFSNFLKTLDMRNPFGMSIPARQQRQAEILLVWTQQKSQLIQKMRESIERIAAWGAVAGVPIGNTEGWGSVEWDDVEGLNWDFIKQSAEAAIPIALEKNFSFICTSNFTHPHFRRLWRDVAWHQAITAQIRSHQLPAKPSIVSGQ